MYIRPARPQDFDAWLALWKGYQDYYEADLSATTDDTWARLMDPPIDGPFALVVEAEDGALVGLMTRWPRSRRLSNTSVRTMSLLSSPG